MTTLDYFLSFSSSWTVFPATDYFWFILWFHSLASIRKVPSLDTRGGLLPPRPGYHRTSQRRMPTLQKIWTRNTTHSEATLVNRTRNPRYRHHWIGTFGFAILFDDPRWMFPSGLYFAFALLASSLGSQKFLRFVGVGFPSLGFLPVEKAR